MGDGSPSPFASYILRELSGHKKKVYTLGWNCNGRKLASGSLDYCVRIWSIEPHSQVKPERSEAEFKGHVDSVVNLAWKPTHPDQLASASGDKTVRFWDIKNSKSGATVNTGAPNIFLTWHPEGNLVAVGNKENTISIVDVRKYRILKQHKFNHEVNEIAWDASGKYFLTTTGDGAVEILSYPNMDFCRSLQAHSSSCYCMALSKDHKYLATGGADALVSLWQLSDLTCITTFTRMDQPVRTLSFSHDSRYLAYAGEDPLVEVVDIQGGGLVYQYTCKLINDSVAWNPVHPVLAFAGDETKEGNGTIGILAPPKS